MTTLDQYLQGVRERVERATPKPGYRVHYPPTDYSGDEWDLLRCPTRDFESQKDAFDFAASVKNRRAPSWAQPHVYAIDKRPPEFCLETKKLLRMVDLSVKQMKSDRDFYHLKFCESESVDDDNGHCLGCICLRDRLAELQRIAGEK